MLALSHELFSHQRGSGTFGVNEMAIKCYIVEACVDFLNLQFQQWSEKGHRNAIMEMIFF